MCMCHEVMALPGCIRTRLSGTARRNVATSSSVESQIGFLVSPGSKHSKNSPPFLRKRTAEAVWKLLSMVDFHRSGGGGHGGFHRGR